MLGEKIRTLRKKKGLSQTELAQQTGISGNHVSRLELGHYQPSADVLKKLADILEVSSDYLLSEGHSDVPEIRLKNQALAESMRALDELDEGDKSAVFRIIDAMLTKRKMQKLLEETAR